MLKNIVLLTLKGIRHRPVRSWLTILGIVLGITLVVIILSLSNGIQKAISKQLAMFGNNLIIIYPGEETNPFAGLMGGVKFREKDIMDLEKIEGIDYVVPIETTSLNLEYKGEVKSILTHAAPWKGMIDIYEKSQGLGIQEGNWPKNDHANEVVFGYLAYKKLFKSKIRVGDDVLIKSKRMRVVGFVNEIGNQMDDNVIYISLENYREISGNRGKVGSAFATTKDGYNINLLSKKIKVQLDKQELVQDFSVITPQKANKIISGVLEIVELVLVFIALISLAVGAVGITNTMYTSVLERTRQIGIMKAIGASKDAILLLFLIESGIIGLVGGLLGILFGISIAYLIGLGGDYSGMSGLFSFASLDYLGLTVILIITFLTGVISGILPAKKAAKMEAAEALRYE